MGNRLPRQQHPQHDTALIAGPRDHIYLPGVFVDLFIGATCVTSHLTRRQRRN